MKTKNLRLAAGVLATFAFANQLNAQSTSYNANTVPVGGTSNCAFGVRALNFTTGIGNVGVGFESLYSNTSGSYNSAVGYQALYLNTADQNSAFGFRAMKNNTTGTFNTATGLSSLYTNATGSNNVANGHQALFSNFGGSNNSATGFNSLYSNTSGHDNVANGHTALYSNTTGSNNVASGGRALYTNAGGSYNVAEGWEALNSNVSGNYNVALGYQALYLNTVSENTALGFRALKNNTTGTYNTGSGLSALYTTGPGSNNSGHGYQALYTNYSGNNNSALGYNADVSSNALSNATAIGASAIVNASNKVRIGNTTVTVIEGQVPFTPSDARFKENITEEVKGLEFINLLRPVVYNFNTRKFEEFLTKNMSPELKKEHIEGKDFGPSTAIRQSGFLAQEVEQAAKRAGYTFNGLHVPENEDDNYSLAYAEFVVPLVKGMQEQQKMIEAKDAKIKELEQRLASLEAKVNNSGTGVGDNGTASDAVLFQNSPNPFNRNTEIRYRLPQNYTQADVIIFDMNGRKIQSIPLNSREGQVTLSANDLAAGIYLYSLVLDGQEVATKRMVVNK